MRGIYIIELEGKKSEDSIFLSDAMLKDGMFGLDGLFMRTIERAKSGKIDSVVVYLCCDDDLLNIWEFRVAAQTAQVKMWSLSSTLRKYIEKYERSTSVKTNRSRKVSPLPEPSKV